MKRKLMRYGIVGVLTLAVYLGAGQGMRWAGLSVAVLGPLAFTLAVAVNYLFQRAWVFNDSRPPAASLPKYIAMVSIGYLINSLVLTSLAVDMPLTLAQCLAALAVVMSNAVLSFLWVFSVTRGN